MVSTQVFDSNEKAVQSQSSLSSNGKVRGAVPAGAKRRTIDWPPCTHPRHIDIQRACAFNVLRVKFLAWIQSSHHVRNCWMNVVAHTLIRVS